MKMTAISSAVFMMPSHSKREPVYPYFFLSDLFVFSSPEEDAGSSVAAPGSRVFLSTASEPLAPGSSGVSTTMVFLSTTSEPAGEDSGESIMTVFLSTYSEADGDAGAGAGAGVGAGVGATTGTDMLLIDELTVEITVLTVEPAVTSDPVPVKPAAPKAGFNPKSTEPDTTISEYVDNLLIRVAPLRVKV